MLKKIFFIALFLNLTFPRAGFYIEVLPITIANILFGLVGLAWLFKRVHYKSRPEGFLEWIGLFYFVYVFFNALFGLIYGEKLKAIIGLVIMAGYGILFFLTLYFLKTRKDVLFITRLMIFSLILIIIYGVLQVILDLEIVSIPGLTELYGSPEEPVMVFKDGWSQVVSGSAVSKNIMWGREVHGTGPPTILMIGHKVFSTFHHGNLFGSHLAIFIPFLFNIALVSSRKRETFLSFFFILAIVVLIFTNSRGAIFALTVSLLSLFAFLSPLDWFKLFSLMAVSFLIFIFTISLAVFYNYRITGVDPSIYLYRNFEPRYLKLVQKTVLFLQSKIKREYNEAESLGDGQEIDNLANRRFSIWREVLPTIFSRDRPPGAILFGNNFKETPYYKSGNFYLWMIFEIGLVGFGLFSVLVGYIIITSLRSLPSIKDQKLKAIVKGGLTGLIAGLSHNIIDAPFYYPPLLANFWILAGLVMVTLMVKERGAILKHEKQ